MDELNQHLTSRFSALRDGRIGPVFFLEHGLPADEREALFEQVREACQAHAIDGSWWREKPYPLIVAATEVGYRYQGCGTDFWPMLSEELGCAITEPQRQALKDLFKQAAVEVRGAVPKPSPWSEAFHLIAWPIAHAIVPREFHRRLATLLADLRVEVMDLDDERLYRAIILSAGARNARFSSFLEDSQLVVAVARHLLVGTSGSLTDEALARIAADLADDGTARREILAARGIQRSLRKKLCRGQDEKAGPIEGRFQIRLQETDLVLEATFPAADPLSVERLRLAVRRIRFAPRLWGVTARISAEQLLVSTPFALRCTERPAAGTPLLPELDHLDIESELEDHLRRYTLELPAQLVFAISEESEDRSGKQVMGSELYSHRTYWVLIDGELSSELRELDRIGSVGSYSCVEAVAASREGRRALESIGYRVVVSASVGFAGAAPLNGDASIPEFVAGDTRILFQRKEHADGLSIRLGDEKVHLSEGSLRIRVPQGEHLLRVSTKNQERRYRFKGVEASAPSITGLVNLSLTMAEGTIQALQSGAVALRIDSLASFDGLHLVLELEVLGYRARSFTTLGCLPQLIQSDDPVWTELLDESVRSRLARSARCELRARVGILAFGSWELEQRVRPYWWTVGREGPLLQCEAGAVSTAAIPAGEAIGPPRDPAFINDQVQLLVPHPLGEDCVGPNEFVTFCVGSTQILAAEPVQRPMLIRQRSSRVDRIGFEDLVGAYLKWSLAETISFGAEVRRRQVARTLDNWVAEICCGTEWAEEELELGSLDAWRILLDRCIEEKLGLDTFVDLQPGEITEVCFEGIAEARRSLPDLLVRAESFAADDRAQLNAAFGKAYEKIADKYETKGRKDKASRIRGGDPSTPIEDWQRVLVHIKGRTTLQSLGAWLLPTQEAHRLMAIDPSVLSLDELFTELKQWASKARGALAGPVPQDDTLLCILYLWVSPARAVEMDWRSAIDTLLTERCISRAARYLSLRARQGA